MKTLFSLMALLLLAIIGVWILPSPIDSIAISPSQSIPLEGPWQPNDTLQSVQITALPNGQRGGEDVAKDQLGCIYTGTDDGAIVRKCPHASWEQLVNTGGRPLGLAWDKQQNLIIADAEKGLLRMTPAFDLEVLADQFQGRQLGVVDDVDVGADGTIYFSDASNRYPFSQLTLDILDGRPSGRLFALNPTTRKITLLADQLAFANGVAVDAQQRFVLVNETFAYRISKIWLAGPKAGQHEIVLDQLPGLPDGIARAENGSYWLSLYALRPTLVDHIHPLPWLKNLAAKLPSALMPMPAPYGFIVNIGPDGQVLQTLHDQAAVAIGGITSVQPENDGLYLGTLQMDRIGKLAF